MAEKASVSQEQSVSPSRRRAALGAIWTLVFLAASACCLLKAAPWDAQASTQDKSAKQSVLRGQIDGAAVAYAQRPIESIRVGERVLAHSPDAIWAANHGDEPIVAENWRKLVLRMNKPDGGRLYIELLRPEEWLDEADADEGVRIDLDMPEFGVVGLAEVVSIQPCPSIASGSGRVVTGTFEHSSAEIIDLFLRGRDKPTGLTASHRIWSADRGAFVEARELHQGEKVGSLDLPAEVVALVPRPEPAGVFNLEVEIDHTYYADGMLVHNSCVGVPKSIIGLGKWGEDKLGAVLGGGEAHVRFVTSEGPRIIDRLVGKVAHEAKAGLNVEMTSRMYTQALKDSLLLKNRSIRQAHWHFFRGASRETVKTLTGLGIQVHVY